LGVISLNNGIAEAVGVNSFLGRYLVAKKSSKK